ncbi:hypothetical protein EX895_001648 [Sporisorium graminicola]|uniref:Dynactin subunit 2 n=1 Tax=Sporisorium graminicola TaxID=280036 RepID=A0A4U7KXX7_9BASI|nr:hypothetical protein EX895_001648 [Sporisorium graminicola]TKY89117.1 hypothetical protein EX895_001648 [Sporisorium graminicola]
MSQQAGASASSATAASSSYTKYASLPDVDTSAPDVYEYQGPNPDTSRGGRQRSRKQRSTDSDSDTSSDESDGSVHRKHAGDGKGKGGGASDDIDHSSLARNDAAAKFSGATHLDAGSADFSGKLQKRKPTRKTNATRPRDAGLETSTYAIDGVAGSGQESVADRLRRLKFEASQLEEEVNANAAASKETVTQAQQVDSVEVLNQLKILQSQLANLTVPPSSKDTSGGERKADKEALRALLLQLKQSSAASASTTSSTEHPATAANASGAAASGSEPRTVGDLVQMEARLSELEATLGLEQAMLDESKPVPRPVLSTLSRLEHQLSILSQPRHLDAISRRVKVLVTEMDRVHDVRRKLTTEPAPADSTSTGTLTATELAQLQQLFNVSARLEPLLPVIPSVLTRLQTLAELHTSAAHFASTLDELHESSSERQVQEQEMEELLRKIEMNMDQTDKKVEANLESLQSRIEQVAARLEKLQG